jgi:hypothetical protein|tara:strand:- start:1356 stop:1604 length:249 start_codon:yes stop_codon:yes gene_type:complete
MKTKQEVPKWFNGQIYDKGAEVTNRFGGDSCYLNNVELSIYDFIIGSSTIMEMGLETDIESLRKGLDWFRKNNINAYMILLD